MLVAHNGRKLHSRVQRRELDGCGGDGYGRRAKRIGGRRLRRAVPAGSDPGETRQRELRESPDRSSAEGVYTHLQPSPDVFSSASVTTLPFPAQRARVTSSGSSPSPHVASRTAVTR